MKFIDERLYRHFVGELVKNLTDQNLSEYAELEARAWLWTKEGIAIEVEVDTGEIFHYEDFDAYNWSLNPTLKGFQMGIASLLDPKSYERCDVDKIISLLTGNVLQENGADIDIINGQFVVQAGDLLDRLIFEREGFVIAEVSDVEN